MPAPREDLHLPLAASVPGANKPAPASGQLSSEELLRQLHEWQSHDPDTFKLILSALNKQQQSLSGGADSASNINNNRCANTCVNMCVLSR